MIQESWQPRNYLGTDFPPYFGALIIHVFLIKKKLGKCQISTLFAVYTGWTQPFLLPCVAFHVCGDEAGTGVGRKITG